MAEQTPRTVRELLRAVARAIFLAVLLLPPVILLVPSLAFPSSERWCRAFESALLRALERGGPCLIKLGQWASTRPDVLPLSLCRALGSLHDRVPPHSLEHSVAAIEEAFGVPCEAMFASLSDEPIGSGCVAQVHIATTAPSVEGSVDAAAASAAVAPHGTRVAIKVLHPGVEQSVALDLYLLRTCARVFEAALSPVVHGLHWLAMREALDEFSAFMALQLDLREEGRNLLAFGARFAGDEHVRFPEPLRRPRHVLIAGRRVGSDDDDDETDDLLASRRVLVESFLEGETLASMLRARTGATRRTAGDAALARVGLKAFLKMVLQDNFVHADLHPGNILVLPGVASVPSNGGGGGDGGGDVGQGGEGDVRLGFVDAGLVVELSAADRANFLALFAAIARGDGERAGELMLSRATEERCADPHAFKQGMKTLIGRVRAGERGAFNLSNVRIGDVLLDVTSLVRTHSVKADPSFTTLVMAIVVLEGLGRELDPTLDLFSVALANFPAAFVEAAAH